MNWGDTRISNIGICSSQIGNYLSIIMRPNYTPSLKSVEMGGNYHYKWVVTTTPIQPIHQSECRALDFHSSHQLRA